MAAFWASGVTRLLELRSIACCNFAELNFKRLGRRG